MKLDFVIHDNFSRSFFSSLLFYSNISFSRIIVSFSAVKNNAEITIL